MNSEEFLLLLRRYNAPRIHRSTCRHVAKFVKPGQVKSVYWYQMKRQAAATLVATTEWHGDGVKACGTCRPLS